MSEERVVKLVYVPRLSHQAARDLDEGAQDRLIETHIEQSPVLLGLSNARTKTEGVPVWALIGYLEAMEGDFEQVGLDYCLGADTIRAALIYYHRHPAAIAARIEENRLLRAE
jgi:uncharacterized protein (DUF433 family)